MNVEEISQLIKARRSVFPDMYEDREISDDTIKLILENANWAPTHKKTEPWRFKIFKKGDSLQRLSDYLSGYYKSNTPEEKFSEIKYKKMQAKPLKSACVIALCMHVDPNSGLPEWEEVAAVSCAVQNMWLTCTALGIGSYWGSPKAMLEANDFLNLGEHEKCLGIFFMGYQKPIELKSTRGDVEDKIEWL